jgi:SAM-dependent methyltransferase
MDNLKKIQEEAFNTLYRKSSVDGTCQTQIGAWLWNKDMEKGLKLACVPVSGLTGLSICCGLGKEAAWMAKKGAIITATDISPVAVRRVQELYPGLKTAVADAERLPFPDKSFDFVFVHHGLHHLPRPIAGLYEMLRTARRFVIMWEAQDNVIMRMLTNTSLFGLLPTGGQYEPSGNYVYRFARRELIKLGKSLYLKNVRISCAWHHNNCVVERIHARFLKGAFGLGMAKTLYSSIDFLVGRWGNNIVAIFEKE